MRMVNRDSRLKGGTKGQVKSSDVSETGVGGQGTSLLLRDR